MTAQIVRLPQPSHGRLECSSCGATTEAQCGCGVPYLPAGARAAKAVAENPGMSDRAIAAEIGVGLGTVQRARKKSTDPHESVGPPAKRIGKDGKARKLPTKRAPTVTEPDDDEPGIEDEIDPENYRTAFLIRADQAVRFAAYSGPINHEIVAATRAAAAAWNKLAQFLDEAAS